tara:strand:- start:121 stop:339 length:219 start_codon:yes stop_codon:yes gene_type:complete
MMSKALLHLMHKDEIFLYMIDKQELLIHAQKNPEVNKMLIPKLQGAIETCKYVLGFDYIEQKEEERNDNTNK